MFFVFLPIADLIDNTKDIVKCIPYSCQCPCRIIGIFSHSFKFVIINLA
jgi:hypothetical protein